MKSILAFFAKRHLLASLFTVMVLLLGLNTLRTLKRDRFPQVDWQEMDITTLYPGASPEDVEQNVTNKLEDKLKGVSGIKDLHSLSIEEVSNILVRVDSEARNPDKVKANIREAVSRVTDFPAEVRESPLISEYTSDSEVVLGVGITGNLPYGELRQIARDFEEKLKNLPGVSHLVRLGYRAREIKVELSPQAVERYQISLNEIIQAIKTRNIRLSGGSFESYTSEKKVITLAQFQDPLEVGEVIVRSTFEGPQVKIKDLAVVKDDFEDSSLMAGGNGEEGIIFGVYKKEEADIIRTVKAVRRLVQEESRRAGSGGLSEDYDREGQNGWNLRGLLGTLRDWLAPAPPVNVFSYGRAQLVVTEDISRSVQNSMRIVSNNGLIGLVLVLLVLGLTFNFRVGFWVALGIPVSVLGACLLLPAFNTFLDTVTLTVMVIMIGIIVDDGIIISENISRYLEQGHPPLQAAIRGTREVFFPVLTTALTTFLAFAPLFSMGGSIGKVVYVIPLTVGLTLCFSILESTLALPAHLLAGAARATALGVPAAAQAAARATVPGVPAAAQAADRAASSRVPATAQAAARVPSPGMPAVAQAADRAASSRVPATAAQARRPKGKARGRGSAKWFDRLRRGYSRLMLVILKLRYPLVLLFLAALGASLWYAGKHFDFVLFPTKGAERFYIQVELPMGSSLRTTVDKIKEIEQIVAALPREELDSFFTRAGRTDWGDLENSGFIGVNLTPYSERQRDADQIVEELRREIGTLPGIERYYFDIDSGGPEVGKPITLRIVGHDDENRRRLSREVKAYLATLEGVKDIHSDDELGKEQLVVRPDYERLARLGLTVEEVARNIRVAFDGEVVTRIRDGNEDLNFRIQLSPEASKDLNTLKRLRVPNREGRLVRLGEVISLEGRPGPQAIRHYNRVKVTTITADIDQDRTTSLEVSEAVMAHFDLERDWPGLKWVVGGEAEETQRSVRELVTSFALAILGIYFLLVLLFKSFSQPFLVLLAVPFGIIGVIVALALHGEQAGFLSMIGVVGLAGVVVNDSLVLVDHLNVLRRKYPRRPFLEVIAQGTANRLRPILLTTLTTAAGLLPLAYGIGGRDLYMSPMALVMGWGLLLATPLTLVLIPCLQAIGHDLRRLLTGRKEALPDSSKTKRSPQPRE